MLAVDAGARGGAGRGGLLGLVAAAVVLLATAPACAQTAAQTLEEALDAYNRGAYTEAVDLLEPMVGGEVPSQEIIDDRLLVREFRKYLGASYVLTSQRADAERQFEALLRAEGERLESYQFDPGGAAFPSSVHDVFDGVRERLVAEIRADQAAQAAERAQREAARREAILALYAQAQENEVEVENQEALAWMPFGIGQFQNGDEGLGYFFAISESALVTLSAGSLAAYLVYLEEYERALRFDPGADPTNLENLLVGLTVLNWVSFGASVITMVAGVIEAVVGYVPRRTIRRERDVDPEILERLELVGAPGGLGLRARF